MPRFYPMMMDLKGRKCVVVGGGEVASRKVQTLLDCAGKVMIIAPKIGPELASMVDSGKITHINGEYGVDYLEGAALAIAATDDEKTNRAVFRDASGMGIPVNVVDVPELCTFIVPSIVERGDLLIAISTSGKSPATAKRIRKEMEEHFGPEYGLLLELMGKLRTLVQEEVKDLDERMKILTKVANSNLLDRLRSGERPTPSDLLKEAL